LPPRSAIFTVDISSVSDLNEAEFCRWLTVEVGVAALYVGVLCNGFDQRGRAFCFAKKET
jgi:methionine aminotransferase